MPAEYATQAGELFEAGGLLRLRALDRYPELRHGITKRRAPDGADWNLSARRGTPADPPSPAVAFANREKLAAMLGSPLAHMVGCRQVHSNVVVRVGLEDGGRGMTPEVPPVEGADAMVTDAPGLYLLALAADCPPVFFYDREHRAIGLAHSGWKGTVGRIAGRTVEMMQREFGSRPEELAVVVGPGIGPCCYAVGRNVIEAVEGAFAGAWEGKRPLLQTRDGEAFFSLRDAIARTLLEAGVLRERVAVTQVCTAHSLDLLYSHRAERGQCGLFGAVLGMTHA